MVAVAGAKASETMRQHGRKTPAALAAIESDERPSSATLPPPPYLNAREAKEWRCIVARFGSSAFPYETRGLLASWCGAAVGLADVNAQLSQFAGVPRDRGNWRKFCDLHRVRGQLTGQLLSLGTKLRILPQSRDVRRLRTTEYERRFDGGERPWNDFKQ